MNGEYMEITQMKYFLEVAKTQHMTQSAQKLHIAQPALSQSIRRLEEELGVPLFMPKGRNIVLSEYGKFLQSQLSPIIDKLDSIPDTLQKMANVNRETIHLNVLAASTLVTNAIIEYESTHKEVNFKLQQDSENDLYDIEITTKMFYQLNPDMADTQFVCPEKIYLAVPNNVKYKNIDAITLKEVENEGFISLMGSRQFRYICDKFCHHAQISPNIIFESDNPVAVKNMIGANLGIGFWPEYTWGEIVNDNVKLLEILDPKCSRDIVITYNRNSENDETTEEFFTFLKEYCTKKASSAAAF